MMFVVCMLHVGEMCSLRVRCLLSVVCCLLCVGVMCVVCCMGFVAWWWLSARCSVLFAVCCRLLRIADRCLLSVVCCRLLPVVWCVVVCCVLFVVCCSLYVVCGLLCDGC